MTGIPSNKCFPALEEPKKYNLHARICAALLFVDHRSTDLNAHLVIVDTSVPRVVNVGYARRIAFLVQIELRRIMPICNAEVF